MPDPGGKISTMKAAGPWHAIALSRVLEITASSRSGLSREEAAQRLRDVGPNALPAKPPPGWIEIGFRQLKNPLIYVLLAAALAALSVGEVTDAIFIGFVLLLNSLIGGWQEWHAERQSHGLQKLLRIKATVIRDGASIEIGAHEIVPGDLVSLESGQRVPADIRLLDAHGLEIDEALLTGESQPVLKDVRWSGADDTALADQRNMAFAGSSVARGRGHGVVVATGRETAVGQLATTMSETAGGKPPLILRMEKYSRTVAIGILLAAVVVGLTAVLVHGRDVVEMFTFATAMAVAAIPEGLPVAVTIALAVAARRMATHGAIVRRLPAVEGLGSCTLIASDKTGTLTCNELTVREVHHANGGVWIVSGAGYEPEGEIEWVEGPPDSRDEAHLYDLLEIAAVCNEADMSRRDGSWSWRGDPTDIALLAVCGKRRIDHEALLLRFPRVNDISFEPERQYAASFHERDGRTWVAVKGAPERVLAMCRASAAEKARMLDSAAKMAARGLRVLALASGMLPRRMDDEETPAEPANLEFAGIMGLLDPLRPGAREAVERCDAAGVRVLMVTGDHPATALAIARELSIADRPEEVIEGARLCTEDRDQLAAAIERARVFARVTPHQKLAIVETAQAAGHFVAVTGDGVNDAPALRRANIGVAMGLGGTDVAREASDLVLSDDNFATIVAGVAEGRIAYRNIRNVVYLLSAAAIAEVATVGAAVMAGLPLPLVPVQLLWLNVVTNGIQDVTLVLERGHGDELEQPPHGRKEPIFNRLMIQRVLLAGAWMACLGIASFVLLLRMGAPLEQARNALLLLMVLLQNVDAFNARSESRPVLGLPLKFNRPLVAGVLGALLVHIGATQTPFLQKVLHIEPLTRNEWFVLPIFALSLMLVMETHKFLRKRIRA
jgi:Ca2+-transporting ATPase